MKEMENWKAVVNYEGWYEVGDLGNVRSAIDRHGTFKGKILKPGVNKKGYRNVVLYKDGKKHNFTVQRLVADAFLGLRPKSLQRNHKDGNKSNNRLDNLEYITPSENILHAFRTGLMDQHGERAHNRKLTREDVYEIMRLWGEETPQALADRFNVCVGTIRKIAAGDHWVCREMEGNDE